MNCELGLFNTETSTKEPVIIMVIIRQVKNVQPPPVKPQKKKENKIKLIEEARAERYHSIIFQTQISPTPREWVSKRFRPVSNKDDLSSSMGSEIMITFIRLKNAAF